VMRAASWRRSIDNRTRWSDSCCC